METFTSRWGSWETGQIVGKGQGLFGEMTVSADDVPKALERSLDDFSAVSCCCCCCCVVVVVLVLVLVIVLVYTIFRRCCFRTARADCTIAAPFWGGPLSVS